MMTTQEMNILKNAKVNIREPKDLGRWCKILRCTADELKVAIYKAGSSVDKIRDYLERVISLKNLSNAL